MGAYTNAKQHIPELFKEIMKLDARLAPMRAAKIVTFGWWKGEMMRKRELLRGAEEFIRKAKSG